MPDWIRQIEDLLRYHWPAAEGPTPWTPIVLSLLGGLALSLAGAKLLRVSLGVLFTGGGGVLGAEVARLYGFPLLAGVVVGAVVLGMIGYLLFRMWLSALAGLLFAVLAVGTVVMPQMPRLWDEFEQSRTGAGPGGTEFSLPTPGAQTAGADTAEYWLDFGRFVGEKRPELVRQTVFVASVSFLFGAAIGLFAYRWAMVLGTVLAGTVLLLFALGALAHRYQPAALEWCRANPRIMLGILLAWLFLAILLQRRGFRSTVQVVQAAAETGS